MNYSIKFPFILALIDSIWITRDIHKTQIESIQKSPLKLDMMAGILFYVLAGLAYSKIIRPFSVSKKDSFKLGAIIGFLMYGTFDLTNKAIFTNYEWSYAIADMVWGSFAMGLASYLSFE